MGDTDASRTASRAATTTRTSRGDGGAAGNIAASIKTAVGRRRARDGLPGSPKSQDRAPVDINLDDIETEEKPDEQALLQASMIEEMAERAAAASGPQGDPDDDAPDVAMRLHYQFDNMMVKWYSSFVLITIITIISTFVGGALLMASDTGLDFWENSWMAWLFLNDGAAHTDLDGKARPAGLLISLVGVIVMSILMGFVVDLVAVQMEELRKGKSFVVEKNHTLILGWTEKIFSIIVEICDANSSEGGGVIVILSETDKEEMETALYDRIDDDDRMGSLLVTREGSPMLGCDLKKVAVNAARSIIVLCSDEGEPERADAGVLRVVLSLCTVLCSDAHVTAELRDVDSEPLLGLVGGQVALETVVSHDIVGRLMVMSVRQPGLSKVFEQILGFTGDEFYVQEWPTATGIMFGDLAEKFADAIVVGVKMEDETVLIKPHMQRPMLPGEEIIVISEDDDTYEYDAGATCSCPQGPPAVPPTKEVEKMLMCGWRRDLRDMLLLLDDVCANGSEIHILAPMSLEDREEILTDTGVDVKLFQNIKLLHHVGNARRHYEKLPLEEFTACLVVADEAVEQDPMSSDSAGISTLLLFRDVQMRKKGLTGREVRDYIAMSMACPVLVEILDARTESSISSSGALNLLSEFVQSNEMVSRVLAMVSEERSVNNILNELLGGQGTGLELQPAKQYISPGETLSFMQLSKRVHEFDEIAVGYQDQPYSDPENTIINPRDKNVPKQWDERTLIVIRGPPMHPELHGGAATVGVAMSK